MNHSPKPEANIARTETSEQQLLSVFAETSFKKEEAAVVLGITVSGAYKLLQRMTEQGLLVAHKQGKQWVYSEPSGMVIHYG